MSKLFLTLSRSKVFPYFDSSKAKYADLSV